MPPVSNSHLVLVAISGLLRGSASPVHRP
jgi:hypothetical protein